MKFSKQNMIATAAVVLIGVGGIATYATAHDHDGDRRGGYSEGHGGKHHGKHRRGGKHVKMLMERFDANGDGSLTQEELDTSRKELLAKHDADGSGTLSLDEFKALWLEVMNRDAVRGFQRLDVDGDAAVTVDEFLEPFSDVVEKFDRNGDGALSKEDKRRRGGKDRMKKHDEQASDDN